MTGLGSTFALDSKRLKDGHPGVGVVIKVFEPGTGKALEIPSNIQTFHDVTLMEFDEAAIAISFLRRMDSRGRNEAHIFPVHRLQKTPIPWKWGERRS